MYYIHERADRDEEKRISIILVVGLLLSAMPQYVMAEAAAEKDAVGTTVTAPAEASKNAEAEAEINEDTKAVAKNVASNKDTDTEDGDAKDADVRA